MSRRFFFHRRPYIDPGIDGWKVAILALAFLILVVLTLLQLYSGLQIIFAHSLQPCNAA